MTTISMDKEYTTRNGLKVVILTLDAPHPNYPVMGYYIGAHGRAVPACWTIAGKYVSSDEVRECDLIEKPKEVVLYRAYYTRIDDPTVYLTIPYKTKVNALEDLSGRYTGQYLKTTVVNGRVTKVELEE